MNTVNNIPEKHLLETSRENYCETVKIIKAVTKIDILFKNHIFLKKINNLIHIFKIRTTETFISLNF